MQKLQGHIRPLKLDKEDRHIFSMSVKMWRATLCPHVAEACSEVPPFLHDSNYDHFLRRETTKTET